jgi:tetratricopeptide (TPR) repeat protein
MYRSPQALLLGLLLGLWPIADLALDARPGLAQGVERSVELRKVKADRLLKEANTLLDTDRPDRKETALPLLEQSLQIYQELQDRTGERQSLKRLTFVYLDLPGQFEKKIQYQERLLVIARESKNQDEERKLLLDLGNDYGQISRYAKSIEYLKRLLDMLRGLQPGNPKEDENLRS